MVFPKLSNSNGYPLMVMTMLILFPINKLSATNSRKNIETIEYPSSFWSVKHNLRFNENESKIYEYSGDTGKRDESDDHNYNNRQLNVGLLPKKRSPLCIDEFIFCASSLTCLDIVCVESLTKQIDYCTSGTIYCPETDECLTVCPPSNGQEGPIIVGTLDPVDYNLTDTLDDEASDNFPEDEGNVTEVMVVVSMVLVFKADYSIVVGNQSSEFIELLRKQLTQLTGLPDSSIQNVIIIPDTFKVTFDLVYWPEESETANVTSSDFQAIVDKIESELSSTGINFNDFKGEIIVAVGKDFVPKVEEQEQQKQETSTQPSSSINPEAAENSGSKDDYSLTLILSLTVGAVILILITIVGIIYSRKANNRKLRKVTPFTQMKNGQLGLTPLSQPNNGNQRLFTGNHEDNLLTRSDDDDNGSLYLSNQFNHNELINGLRIPNAAIYVPPGEQDLKSTPKSITNRVWINKGLS